MLIPDSTVGNAACMTAVYLTKQIGKIERQHVIDDRWDVTLAFEEML